MIQSIKLKVGGHYYQFYKTMDDYLHISLSYIYAGLKKGNACLWLVNDQIGIEKAEQEFLSVYPDATGYLVSHQMQIKSAQTWYLNRGSFDMGQALQNAMIFLESCTRRDFISEKRPRFGPEDPLCEPRHRSL